MYRGNLLRLSALCAHRHDALNGRHDGEFGGLSLTSRETAAAVAVHDNRQGDRSDVRPNAGAPRVLVPDSRNSMAYNAHMHDNHFRRRRALAQPARSFVIVMRRRRGQQPRSARDQHDAGAASRDRPAGRRGGPGGGAPPPRPILPAAASSIAAKPESFYGQFVTIYATVEQTLAPTAFSVDQDKTKSTGQEVLVLAPRLHEPVQPNTYVTVIGEVVHADAGEIAKKARPGTPALPADVLAKYQGKPVILATAVINAAFTDLARFIPPPMTPEEAVLDKAMKAVGPANGALRKGSTRRTPTRQDQHRDPRQGVRRHRDVLEGARQGRSREVAQTARDRGGRDRVRRRHGQLERGQDAEHHARPAVRRLPRVPRARRRRVVLRQENAVGRGDSSRRRTKYRNEELRTVQ